MHAEPLFEREKVVTLNLMEIEQAARSRMAVAHVAICYASSEPVPQYLITSPVCSAPSGDHKVGLSEGMFMANG